MKIKKKKEKCMKSDCLGKPKNPINNHSLKFKKHALD